MYYNYIFSLLIEKIFRYNQISSIIYRLNNNINSFLKDKLIEKSNVGKKVKLRQIRKIGSNVDQIRLILSFVI